MSLRESHHSFQSVRPPEELDSQVSDLQTRHLCQLTTSLVRRHVGWIANHALQRAGYPWSDQWMDTFLGAGCARVAGTRPSLI
jgi:hypothetical protein